MTRPEGKITLKCCKCSYCIEIKFSELIELKALSDVNGGTDGKPQVFNYLHYCPQCKRIARVRESNMIDSVIGLIAADV